MTSEEIIQRLLSEDKITAKEALIILKDIAKVAVKDIFDIPIIEPSRKIPMNPVVVMYGVTTSPTTYNTDN